MTRRPCGQNAIAEAPPPLGGCYAAVVHVHDALISGGRVLPRCSAEYEAQDTASCEAKKAQRGRLFLCFDFCFPGLARATKGATRRWWPGPVRAIAGAGAARSRAWGADALALPRLSRNAAGATRRPFRLEGFFEHAAHETRDLEITSVFGLTFDLHDLVRLIVCNQR